MLIDCGSCTVRGAACSGCLVTALLDAPEQVEQLGAGEHRAIEMFARAGFEVEVLPVTTSVPVTTTVPVTASPPAVRPALERRPRRRRRAA